MSVTVKLRPGGTHMTEDGVLRSPGDEFEVSEREAILWVERFIPIGRAEVKTQATVVEGVDQQALVKEVTAATKRGR